MTVERSPDATKWVLISLLLVLSAAVTAAADGAKSPAIESAPDSAAWEEAVRSAAHWVDREPESAEAHFRLALALRTKIESVGKLRALTSVGRYRRALDRAIELDPRHVMARQERIGYRIFAPGIAGGDHAAARAEIEELAKIDEEAAWQMRVVLAEAEGDEAAKLAAEQRLQTMGAEGAPR